MTHSSRRLSDSARRLSLLAAALLALGAPAARAAGWSEFHQASLKGALFSTDSGNGAFLLACDAPNDVLLQANIPEGAKVKAGKTARLSFSVDGRRFSYSGKVLNTDDGTGAVMMAEAKVSDPLVKALAKGQALTVSLGRASYEVPLEGAAPVIASFVSTCGGAPRTASPAAAAEPPPAAQTASVQAPAEPAAQPLSHGSGGSAVPPASEIAAAIFVDKKEGQRIADKLKVERVDLNGDGTSEAIITVKDPGWCSENGCTIFVVDFSEGRARTIGEFIGSSLDPAKTSTGGWRDLTLRAPGGSEIENFVDGSYR